LRPPGFLRRVFLLGAGVRMSRGVNIGRARRQAFLAALRDSANVSASAHATGVERWKWYRLRRADSGFAAEWLDALETGIDALEDEAMRRALEGGEEPVFYQGKIVGSVRKYSDTLLMFMLKARRPERCRDRVGVDVAEDVRALLKAVDGQTHVAPEPKKQSANDERS